MKYVYATSDLGLAAYLHALGHRLEKLDRVDPRRVQFCFEASEELAEVVDKYWKGTARVQPLELLTSQRVLKHRLYDQP